MGLKRTKRPKQGKRNVSRSWVTLLYRPIGGQNSHCPLMDVLSVRAQMKCMRVGSIYHFASRTRKTSVKNLPLILVSGEAWWGGIGGIGMGWREAWLYESVRGNTLHGASTPKLGEARLSHRPILGGRWRQNMVLVMRGNNSGGTRSMGLSEHPPPRQIRR